MQIFQKINMDLWLSLVCLEILVQILQGTESCYLPVAILHGTEMMFFYDLWSNSCKLMGVL